MSDVFEVEDVIDKRQTQFGEIYYKVKWLNYPIEDSTWEPASNLHGIKKLIDKYEKKQEKYDKYGKYSSKLNLHEKKESKYSYEGNEKDINQINLLGNKHYNFCENIEGSLEYDVPEKILSGKKERDTIKLKIQWKKRYDNTYPSNSYVDYEIFEKMYPYLLLSFLKSKLKF